MLNATYTISNLNPTLAVTETFEVVIPEKFLILQDITQYLSKITDVIEFRSKYSQHNWFVETDKFQELTQMFKGYIEQMVREFHYKELALVTESFGEGMFSGEFIKGIKNQSGMVVDIEYMCENTTKVELMYILQDNTLKTYFDGTWTLPHSVIITSKLIDGMLHYTLIDKYTYKGKTNMSTIHGSVKCN